MWRQRVQPEESDGGLRLLWSSLGQIQQLLCDFSLSLLPQRRPVRGFTATFLRVQCQHSSQGEAYGCSLKPVVQPLLNSKMTLLTFPFRLEAGWRAVQSCEPLDVAEAPQIFPVFLILKPQVTLQVIWKMFPNDIYSVKHLIMYTVKACLWVVTEITVLIPVLIIAVYRC